IRAASAFDAFNPSSLAPQIGHKVGLPPHRLVPLLCHPAPHRGYVEAELAQIDAVVDEVHRRNGIGADVVDALPPDSAKTARSAAASACRETSSPSRRG